MKLEELKKLYEEARTPYRRIETIEKLSLEIKNNNGLLLRSIEEILEICQSIKGLRENISLCSFVIHILIQSRKPEALYILLKFIKYLPTSTPFVFVEFLSKLLPSYGKIIVGPTKELIEFPKNSPQHAIGIQSLCNLFLDGTIGDENLPYLLSLLEDFQSDIYFSNYLVEMVKSTNEYQSFIKNEKKEIEEFETPDDFLVKKEPN